jgi:hypothetical protein
MADSGNGGAAQAPPSPLRLWELERELGEAHQREAAAAELLQVINLPQFALQSVFDAIAQRAGQLCEAEIAFVFPI